MKLTIDKGAVNDITVSVNSTDVTVQQAQNILVEVTPTPSQTVNIDRGLIGPQGAQGEQGPQGIQGEKGDTGAQGPKGDTGATGAPGAGVATGGTTGQVLVKASNANYDTIWVSLSGLSYQGTWNASSNTPALTSSVGTQGNYYIVNVAGSTNLNGITDWQIGDWAIFEGSIWQKIDNTDTVTSVNGYTGTVVLTQTDISGTVPTSRTITAGTGLSGGGDLSANRTLNIANTGVTATTYGSASSVPVVAVNAQGQITSATSTAIAIANTAVSGLGTMSTQNANAVAITGGSINGTTIGASIAADITGNTVTAATGFISQNFTGLPALGGNLKSSAGVALLNWDGAGSGNVTVNGGLNANPANKNVSIAPTGTGTATINPATTGAMDNMVIGAATPKAITGTTITATSFVGSGASLTNVVNSLSASTGISVSAATGAITVTNTAPDQTVSLTAGTGIGVTGTYPNFTVTNTSPSSGGTVTSVAATVPSFLSVSGSPITSSGTLALTYSGTALPVANGGTGVTTSTGSGSNVLNTSPTLTTPAITGGTISNLTQELIGQSTDQGTGVLQVTGQSTFNGAVTDKSLNLQGGNNLVLNSATLVTQNITVTANTYTLSMTGTGTITLSGTSSGTLVGTGASTVVSKTFTPTAGTLTLTPTGSCTTVQLELGSVFSGYTPTTGSAVTTTNNINVPSGQVLVQNGTASLPSYSFVGQPTLGIYSNLSDQIRFRAAYVTTSAGFEAGTNLGVTNGTGYIYWGSSGQAFLYSDAANTLAQRNSTNAQTFRLYGTYTDASNYERLSFDYGTTNAGAYTISTQKAGTGSIRPLYISTLNSAGTAINPFILDNGANYLYLGSSGINGVRFINTIQPYTDATYDVGVASTNRWRNAYFSGVVTTNSDASINTVTVGLGNNSVAGNTAVGSGALFSITASGSGNTAIGLNTLNANTSAINSTAIGNSALKLNTGAINTAVGAAALTSNTSGVSLTALGAYAGLSNTTGSNSTFLGQQASYNNTTGSGISSIGYSSLFYNTTASNLVAIGQEALKFNTTNVATLGTVTGGTGYTNGTYTGVVMTLSSGSTALTYPTVTIVVSGGAVTTVTLTSNGVGFKDTTTVLTAPVASIGGTGSGFTVPVATLASGTGNVAVGYQAGYSNSTASFNNFNGYQAGYSVTTGSANTYAGYQSGYFSTTASNNSFYGNSSGLNISSGGFSVAVGSNALRTATTVSQNVAIGYSSLNLATSANNTATGYYSLQSTSSGANNTAFGCQAGTGNSSANANTTGSNNTYIGVQTVGSANNNTNEMVIGYTAVGLGSNTTVIGNSSTTLTKTFGVHQATTYTVATLPSASTSGVGARAFVTDALAPVFGATVVTGGAIPTPVYSDGTNWKVG